ncbi:DUF3347 domain-containing protein [Paradesertivirga mongoliensis]|uniref:DUF3347 domain-containing protein n=1 Tax=Paradesertivirga mongoliensis TaxID=2100740 RepID=A0ABW4ZJ58_9SPHI|nr:DUF3347 domain-containing protein [Pedobacter mongoliensis]
MKMNTILLSSLAVAIAVSTACTSETPKENAAEHESHESENMASEAGNPEFKDAKSQEVYQHYIHLKTALVNSDGKEAQAGASALSTALTDAGNKKAADISSQIAASADIKAQRDNFDELTAEVESFVKGAGLKSGKIYKQYCPMAKDGDGAYWLASESDIKNPYYGDEMLTCGEVKEEIK